MDGLENMDLSMFGDIFKDFEDTNDFDKSLASAVDKVSDLLSGYGLDGLLDGIVAKPGENTELNKIVDDYCTLIDIAIASELGEETEYILEFSENESDDVEVYITHGEVEDKLLELSDFIKSDDSEHMNMLMEIEKLLLAVNTEDVIAKLREHYDEHQFKY